MGTPRLKPNDSNTTVIGASGVSIKPLIQVCSCALRSKLVSITCEPSRSTPSSSRSCSIASIRSCSRSTVLCLAKGWRRRVSE